MANKTMAVIVKLQTKTDCLAGDKTPECGPSLKRRDCEVTLRHTRPYWDVSQHEQSTNKQQRKWGDGRVDIDVGNRRHR